MLGGMLFAFVGCDGEEGKIDNAEEVSVSPGVELTEGTFAYYPDQYAYYGSVDVLGYAKIEERPEAWCEENCEIYDYVSFVILETENEDLMAFMQDFSGNAFVGENSIGLGCLVDEQIVYINSSDEIVNGYYELPTDLTRSIVGSTEEEPIVLLLDRASFTGGSGADTCYSHFTEMSLVGN